MDNNELVVTKQHNTKQSVTDTFTISSHGINKFSKDLFMQV